MLLLVQLVLGVAVVLAPGALVARALGVRRLSAAIAWSLALVFAALSITFAASASLGVTLVLLIVGGLAAIPFARRGGGAGVPGRGWVFAAGAVLGLLLWHVAGNVGGDGFFHLARVQKLLAFDDLSLHALDEFPDGGSIPATRSRCGTASSRWSRRSRAPTRSTSCCTARPCSRRLPQ